MLRSGSRNPCICANGEGTRVSIYLPQGAAETTGTEVEALSIAAGNHARRALLVEDKQTVRYAIGRLLERLGYEVMTAESGADALAEPWRVIVLSISCVKMCVLLLGATVNNYSGSSYTS